MNLKLVKSTVVIAVLMSSFSAMAQTPEKNGDIGSATGKSVTCTVRGTALDVKNISVFHEVEAKLDLRAFGEILMAEGKTVSLGDKGYRVHLSPSVKVGKSFRTKGADNLEVSATFDQVDSAGKVKILAQNNYSSDEEVSQFPGMLYANMSLTNPEFLTVWYAQPVRSEGGDLIFTSQHQLVTKGLLPDGTVTSVQVFCIY